MSAYTTLNRTASINQGSLHRGLRPRLAAAVRQFGARFRRALRVMATRPDASRLDDRMLADLGISRAQAHFEASRAPWRID
ncbi:MAG TPA: DUF1127 domain-containing protein [Acetobacteraceae bacterium]|jgi:uncharacterized protein YjiS (DUF1127 family)|nr:DUF1127 domain-containing protein [Acetobacteraceae bacterium]